MFMCSSLNRPVLFRRQPRGGKVLIVTALSVPALLGMIGLVIDTGLLLAAHGHLQSAADAAAMAASMDLVRGKAKSVAISTANDFVKQHNALSNAPNPVVNLPPKTGPRAGDSTAVEVIVSYPVRTFLIHVFGGGGAVQNISARAIAAYEPQGAGGGVITLNTAAVPGIKCNGNAELRVNGTVIDNSEGGGVDESGVTVSSPYPGGQAMDLPGNARVRALSARVVGGVSDPSKVLNWVSGGPSPLKCRILPQPDPFANLPTPTTGVDPSYVRSTVYPGQNLSGGGSTTLSPGVYPFIKIAGNHKVTFLPGVYVLTGGGIQASGNRGRHPSIGQWHNYRRRRDVLQHG